MLELLPHLAAGTGGDWSGLIGILLLLTAALVLGTIAERLKQNAILGYLVAGTLIGPNVLGLIHSRSEVEIIAEIGVALLLFTVGLEISIKRLLRMGPIALLGGLLQVTITMAAVFGLSMGMGLDIKAAVCLGAMLALSSTACVIRLLADNSAIDAVYGRNAVGILLFQDIAVMPLVLTVTILSGTGDDGSGGSSNALWMLLRSLLYAGLMVLGFWVLMNYVVPRLLNIRQWAKNRELPILMAVVLAVGSAVIAHKLGISAAMGAFIAGILLAESPFATQVRADVGALRTVLVTLFFASIGMLAEPVWAAQNALLVLGASTFILILKPAIIWFIARRFGFTHGQSLATGLCLAQVGEFSFVLAEVARGTAISEDIFRLVVASTIVTLFATPFLVRFAPTLGNRLQSWMDHRKRKGKSPDSESADQTQEDDSDSQDIPETKPVANRILIIGFGPAGQCVAETLIGKHREKILILDQNQRNAASASRMGLAVQVGSGASPETLEHAHIELADVVVITIPDPHTVRQIIHACRSLNPNAKLIVRSRYHVYRWELMLTGATEVIDEEEQVGHRLAVAARRQLEPDE
ncbi:MAG: cation:proton antiporter [Phycisphaeraceae bacterium JB051]